MDYNYKECQVVAEEIAREAGEMIRDAFYVTSKSNMQKSNKDDLVTETDKAVEVLIKKRLNEKYPTFNFIGEESVDNVEKSVASQLKDKSSPPTWVVDPIDGTTNFVHCFPQVAVSIGLIVNEKAVAGVIYNPILDQMYSASLGNGATLNGTKVEVNAFSGVLDEALVSCGIGFRSNPEIGQKRIRTFTAVAESCRGIRVLGSAALMMAMIGAGNCQIYYEQGIHAWDMAAGASIVTEAGGYVCDIDGGAFDVASRRVIAAASKGLADQIQPLIEPIEYKFD